MSLTTPETRVGIFTLVAIVGLAFLFTWLNGIQLFQKGYTREAYFERIEGLRPGAPVKFAGVDVGRVTRIYFENTKVIVAMRIQPEYWIPKRSRAIIASAGVVGDKYIELASLRPEDPDPIGGRIVGQNLVTMEQFYSTAYDVLASLKQITSDVQSLTSQFSDPQLRMQLNGLIRNIALTSIQLAEASATANRFLTELSNNGQTAIELRQTLAHANTVSANLEKFSSLVIANGPAMEELLKDAHTTMESINQAAQTINRAVSQLTTGEGDPSQTLNETGEAVKRVTNYVSAFARITAQTSLGAGYRDDADPGISMDYRLDVNFDRRNALLFSWDDIGQDNLGTLQWVFKNTAFNHRVGIYNNEFGLGLDLPLSKNYYLGFDLWDTETANLGLTSNWRFNEGWSLMLNDSAPIDTWDQVWSLEFWRNY